VIGNKNERESSRTAYTAIGLTQLQMSAVYIVLADQEISGGVNLKTRRPKGGFSAGKIWNWFIQIGAFLAFLLAELMCCYCCRVRACFMAKYND